MLDALGVAVLAHTNLAACEDDIKILPIHGLANFLNNLPKLRCQILHLFA